MPKRKAKKQTRNNERLILPNGCSCTQPYISPVNWDTAPSSFKQPWHLRFTFYDPIRRPQGKPINWEGMNGNEHTTWEARCAAARQLLENSLTSLKNGYNPVIGDFVALPVPQSAGAFTTHEPEDFDPAEIINLDAPLLTALEWAAKRATWTHRTRIDVKSYMKSILPAILILKYDKIALGQITFQHIDNILAQTFKITIKYNTKTKKEVKINWSNLQKNRAKAYLSSHFGVLKKKKVITVNPCSGMEDLPWETKEEDAYTPDQLQAITNLLWSADPDYALFMLLFYDSGARETEFMKLRKEDIDLERQQFRREILKGLHNRKKKNTLIPKGVITDASLPYWRKALENCKDGDYVFSRGFRPGPRPIRPDNINKRWCKIVKPHFPDSRPYLMKHTNLTSVTDEVGNTLAARKAGHTTTEMIDKHYDKRRDRRTHEVLKTKSNLHLLGAPQLLPEGLPSSAACVVIAAPTLLLPSAPIRIPCAPCLVTNVTPAKQYKILQAA